MSAVAFKEEVKSIEQQLNIRRLDPAEDNHLFEIAFGWIATAPSWRKQIEAVFGTVDLEDYLDAIHDPGRCDVGVFQSGKLIAIVTFTLRAKYTYEVHLEAAPDADPALIVQAGWWIRDQIFGVYGAKMVYMWTPTWHRTVIAISKAIGFHDDGVRMLHGTCRNRLIEWVRLSIQVDN